MLSQYNRGEWYFVYPAQIIKTLLTRNNVPFPLDDRPAVNFGTTLTQEIKLVVKMHTSPVHFNLKLLNIYMLQ